MKKKVSAKKKSSKKLSKGKIVGIGGIFFKSKDQKKMKDWYAKVLGMPLSDWGGCEFLWRHDDNPKKKGYTVWSLFPSNTKYMKPSRASFMVN